MLFNLTTLAAEPIHTQISRQLLRKILASDSANDWLLPNPRALASEQHVSVSSILRAYHYLETLGVITRANGSQYIVRPLRAKQEQLLRQQIDTGETGRCPIDMLSSSHPTLKKLHRLEEEIELARQLQVSLLPKKLPSDGNISLAADSQPSQTVGGDFYDYLPIDEHRFGLVIADACGKGLPAAMLIAQIQAVIKGASSNGHSIRKIIATLNKLMVHFVPSNQFATLFYGIFNRKNSSLRYVRAGHHPPILIHEDGSSEFLETGGPGLGILKNPVHQLGTVRLTEGDVLLLYTDGITESMDSSGREYGEERLVRLLSLHRHLNVREIMQALWEDSGNFYYPQPPEDDRTMVVFKLHHREVD